MVCFSYISDINKCTKQTFQVKLGKLKMSNQKHRHISYFMSGMNLVYKGFSYSVGLMENV